jgi:hypothetical protein
MYFTQDHEDAILKFCTSEDRAEKEKLYIDWIQPAFNQMVDKIVFSYKFTNLPNIDELRMECKVWLTTILDKYDPNRGSKAFSYFSVITKNWFIHKVKRNTKRLQREIPYENAELELETTFVDPGDQYYQERVSKEFWTNLWSEIESWDIDYEKEAERKVYEAVKIILSSVDDNKMRVKYRDFKKNWDDGKI